jgi:hypothetical protein
MVGTSGLSVSRLTFVAPDKVRWHADSYFTSQGADMTRTPQEIFAQHGAALGAGDIDRFVADYSDDAVFITPRGVRHGKDGVRAAFTELLIDLPDAKWDVPTQIFTDDVLFIEWNAVSASRRAMDGIDTFVFDGDGIRVQTVRYTLESTA